MELRGSFPVMITPMNQDESVDYGGLRDNIEFYLSQGAKGLIPLGSTGEFVSLGEEERKRVIEATAEQVNGRVPIIAGTGAETTAETIAYTRHAKENGAAAAMVIQPYYCKPLQEEMYEHFAAIARAVDIPIMVYNNPWTSGVDMSEDTVIRLARDFENIAYIKESTGDIKRLRNILMATEGCLKAFCGWDDLVIESWQAGAIGWVSVAGNVVPRMVTDLFDLVVERGEMDEGWVLYKRLIPFCRFLEESGKLVQITKAAMDKIGQAGGPARRPRLPLTAEQERKLDALLTELGVLA